MAVHGNSALDAAFEDGVDLARGGGAGKEARSSSSSSSSSSKSMQRRRNRRARKRWRRSSSRSSRPWHACNCNDAAELLVNFLLHPYKFS